MITTKEPSLHRGYADKFLSGEVASLIPELLQYSTEPVDVDFYKGSLETGEISRHRLNSPSHLSPLFKKSCEARAPHIYYLFNLEETWPLYKNIVTSCPLDQDSGWRRYSSLVSLASTGSCIHAHVDLIDALIIQLEGEREWNVWERFNDHEYSRKMNGNTDIPSLPAQNNSPTRFVLQPGDALYIPSLFPHSAVAPELLSLSISLGWSGITPARIIYSIIGEKTWILNKEKIFKFEIDLWGVVPNSNCFTNLDIVSWCEKNLKELILSLSPKIDFYESIQRIDFNHLSKLRIPC